MHNSLQKHELVDFFFPVTRYKGNVCICTVAQGPQQSE